MTYILKEALERTFLAGQRPLFTPVLSFHSPLTPVQPFAPQLNPAFFPVVPELPPHLAHISGLGCMFCLSFQFRQDKAGIFQRNFTNVSGLFFFFF